MSKILALHHTNVFLYEHKAEAVTLQAEATQFFTSLDLWKPYPAWFMGLLASGRVQYNKELKQWRLDLYELPQYFTEASWFVRIIHDGTEIYEVYSDDAFKLFWTKVES